MHNHEEFSIFEEKKKREVVAPPRFELRSKDPESPMIDHYTTGLCNRLYQLMHLILFYWQKMEGNGPEGPFGIVYWMAFLTSAKISSISPVPGMVQILPALV